MESAKLSLRQSGQKKTRCAVKGCESSSFGEMKVRFHNLPVAGKRFVYTKNEFGQVEKTDQLEAWINAVKLEKMNTNTKLCSLHFRKDDYLPRDDPGKKRYLNSIAVPSCNLPCFEIVDAREVRRERAREARRERAWRRNLKDNKEFIHNFEVVELDPEQPKDNSPESSEDIIDPLVTDKQSTSIGSESVTTTCGIPAQNNFLKPKLIDFISSDAKLSSLTGIESFAQFNAIVEIVRKMFGNELEHDNTKMSIRDKVLMCYVKLKQNMTYNCLAILSHCRSGKTCERIVFDLIKALSACLKGVIKWPSRETISKNLPQCFEGFEDVRVILDCTEVSIQQRKNLCCQLTTRSTNEKSQTRKLMTGVTPAGHVSYVSKVHGGQTSDKDIFSDSDIVNLLEPGDAIMADRGFSIDEDCISNNWKLYRPPVLKEKKQFTNADAILKPKIAKARVHTKWSSRRIKTFKILRETMPSNLIPVIEDIFTVICATVNLSSPILKGDKFMYDISSEQYFLSGS